jgi:hypothetical protein
MVGVLAQFDPAPNPLLGPTALSDQPWMAGPVTSLQLGDGLLLDAHAAWGSADPLLGHAADRQTLDAHLTSKQELGPWRFSPSIGFAHALEKGGTVDAQLATVSGQQPVVSDRVEVKPEVAYHIDMGQSGFMEPKIMVGTYWDLGDAGTTGAATGVQHEPRHMAETGITFGTGDGTKLQVGGGLEQGETPSENVWSGKVQLSIPLR